MDLLRISALELGLNMKERGKYSGGLWMIKRSENPIRYLQEHCIFELLAVGIHSDEGGTRKKNKDEISNANVEWSH